MPEPARPGRASSPTCISRFDLTTFAAVSRLAFMSPLSGAQLLGQPTLGSNTPPLVDVLHVFLPLGCV